MNSFVSVCMITYNHENFIREAIEGILMQQVDFKVELIIADDASPDSTEEIVMDIINCHPKGEIIKYFKHSRNKGMIHNFVWALEQCNGKYVALCEGDDYWTDVYKLNKQVSFLEQNNSFSLCSHYSKMIHINGGITTIGKFDKSYFTLSDTEVSIIRFPSASLVFRNFNPIPDWFLKVYGGDNALIYQCSLLGNIKVLDFVGSVYRVHSGGIEQIFKKDKVSLPLRNISEFQLYRQLVSCNVKWVWSSRISWNYFYLGCQMILSLKLFKATNAFYHSLRFFLFKNFEKLKIG